MHTTVVISKGLQTHMSALPEVQDANDIKMKNTFTDLKFRQKYNYFIERNYV